MLDYTRIHASMMYKVLYVNDVQSYQQDVEIKGEKIIHLKSILLFVGLSSFSASMSKIRD